MYHLQGRVRQYDPATDTCSVEFEHLGDIEGWMDNIAIDAAISRGFLAHHAQVTLQVADFWRLAEAILIGVGDQPTIPSQLNSAGGAVTVQTGRTVISTNGVGSGSTSVTFSPAFTNPPTSLGATADDHRSLALSALTASGFTATISGGPINSYVYFTWQASGT